MTVVIEESDIARVDSLKSLAASDGIARFRLESRQQLVEFSAGFGELLMHRDADPDTVTVVRHIPAVEGEDGYVGLSAAPCYHIPMAPETGSSNLMGVWR
ncbi:hypothetical protein ACFQ0G_25485 [Streptomyces chiangmaiensis]